MKKRIAISITAVLILTLATVSIASHIVVPGISITQVDENAAAIPTGPGPYFQDLFPAAPIGALGALLPSGGGFDESNGDDTLFPALGAIARIQSAVYEGTGDAEGLFAYVYQSDCTGGLVQPITILVPLSGATLHPTGGGLGDTFTYISTFFNPPTTFGPLPTTLFTGNLVNFNLSEFGGSFGIGGDTAQGWTDASQVGDNAEFISTISNFWSGTLGIFVTDRPPVIGHATVTAGLTGTGPDTVAVLMPTPGVGDPDVPPGDIIVDPPDIEPLIEVVVDVKPGSDPNAVNTQSHGQLPIGIYGSDTFDVAEIDVDTIAVECMGFSAGGFNTAIEDLVVEDGIDDMILHVPMQSFPWGAPPGTLVDVIVTGQLFDGTVFFGVDVVLIVQ